MLSISRESELGWKKREHAIQPASFFSCDPSERRRRKEAKYPRKATSSRPASQLRATDSGSVSPAPVVHHPTIGGDARERERIWESKKRWRDGDCMDGRVSFFSEARVEKMRWVFLSPFSSSSPFLSPFYDRDASFSFSLLIDQNLPSCDIERSWFEFCRNFGISQSSNQLKIRGRLFETLRYSEILSVTGRAIESRYPTQRISKVFHIQTGP